MAGIHLKKGRKWKTKKLNNMQIRGIALQKKENSISPELLFLEISCQRQDEKKKKKKRETILVRSD